MRCVQVDLYEQFHIPRPEGAAGRLTAWVASTSEKVSVTRRRPAVLILPGGAYAWNSPREAEPVALRFAARGWAAYVLEYSCTPHVFPTALREAAMAVAWVRAHAREDQTDPHKLAAVGFSAGGHLCGTLGTLWDGPEIGALGLGDGLRPDALGLCYPVAVSWGRTHAESFRNLTGGDTGLERRLSLDKLVRPDMPPVFLWHTRDDPSVPCRNSLVLAQALEEAGVDFALHIYRRGCHGLATADELVYPAGAVPPVSWDVPGWVEAMLRFFRDCGLTAED